MMLDHFHGSSHFMDFNWRPRVSAGEDDCRACLKEFMSRCQRGQAVYPRFHWGIYRRVCCCHFCEIEDGRKTWLDALGREMME